MRTKAVVSLLLLAAVAALAFSCLPGCKGRKVRAELIRFAQVLEETRAAGNAISDQLMSMQSHSIEDPVELAKNLDNMVRQIDTLIAPVKALNLGTEEAKALRELYLQSWGSLRDAMVIIFKMMQTDDETLKGNLQGQLQAKMAVFNQSGGDFEKRYKELMDKYGITFQDLSSLPPSAPVTPSPVYPSPQPGPFSP